MKEEKIIKRFPIDVRLNTLLMLFKNTNNNNVFDFSTDAKMRKFLDKFMNESCTLKYKKIKDEYHDAMCAYRLYTSENLVDFITNPEVIDFIINSEKFNDIKFYLPKKIVKNIKNESWKEIEYVPVVDEMNEFVTKLEKEYKDFHTFADFYKIRKYNPKSTYKIDYNGIVVYDVNDPKNINKVFEFPMAGTYKDNTSYVKMCKVHWCKENKYNLSEKFKDARIMTSSKYNEFINN